MKSTFRLKRALGIVGTAVLSVGLLAANPAAAEETPDLELGTPSQATQTNREKIDIMGLWAHPDDDAGFTTPCGVWNDLYGIRCGIIMATRGEGGSNSVGPEAGPDLGLRRENEDRTSHYRSGTVDIFNLDRVDFYYNTSAPLTDKVWDGEETLRRTVRIIRETQPEILVGWPSALKAGHGNHQYAQGRMIWEAAAAAADPARYPEQLTGLGAVKPWQVKKILAGAMTAGDGGIAAPECNTGFTPAANNPFTVVGTWTGFDSPYKWLEGNLAGQPAGSAKTWAQAGREGGRAHPTQERVMQKDVWAPTCQRYGVAQSLVPMQPNGSAASVRDDAVLFGATVADPGGMPLGSWFYLEPADYFQAAGVPFTVKAHYQSGSGDIAGGELGLKLPDGWIYSGAVALPAITADGMGTMEFTVTPAPGADSGRFKVGLTFANATVNAYNDVRVELVPAVEGRLLRSGLDAEYEEWAGTKGSFVEGRSGAVTQIGTGETATVSIEVSNRTPSAQSGTVAISAGAEFVLDATDKPFGPLASMDTTTVDFVMTQTNPGDPGNRTEEITVTTTSGAGTSVEKVQVRVVPTTVVPQLAAAPTLTGDLSQYTGPELNVSTRWEGKACDPEGVDCGAGTFSKVGWYDDALYLYTKVVDDIAGGAVTPNRCFGHWITDSVELLFDPLTRSIDTAPTFKLGVFPYTDDPDGSNGNGVNGPCWSRDADNHQGFSTGPLADTILNAPNAPGVEITSQAAIDGEGKYVDGSYIVEAKIPFAALPTAVVTSAAPTGDAATNVLDPMYLGMNITPYDSDNLNFVGETRLAWSAFGSQQSEPLRWGHAYLDGYTAPAGAPTEAPAALIPDTALTGVESPQTIYQSAVRGGTISGVQPTQALSFGEGTVATDKITLPFTATADGTVRAFVWKGNPGIVPVWTSSCPDDELGFEACSPSDGAAPPWGPDMGGRLKASATVPVTAGTGEVQIPLDADIHGELSKDSIVLVSFEESDYTRGAPTGDGVDAWSFPIVVADPATTPPPAPSVTPTDPQVTPSTTPTTPGTPSGTPSASPTDKAELPSTLSKTGATVGFVALAVLLLGGGIGAVTLSRRRA